ncbi:16S rRNA (guanine527-N7)-methyltransferase [Sinobaca qinghaiensis]|uniref:Ribosomal RNA small subunit methyltransferase G n=1 Tax=Sinobaca qinghaiensis TaxID=342944 RepID=A0A419UU91_9BACL|nr:16S rRNA (guanine(527)-N(7))-methyltransferase RsmG [Sinobaca qinghaiensis]RKD68091.1 16S rRNA (guanine527-N7)-methyltransferase [Sinobaca qinghaiensis]
MSKEKFPEWAAAEGIVLSAHQLKQFESYYTLLIEWNKKMNLTGITDEDEVYEKHFFDSISAVKAFPTTDRPLKIIDIGAGAGFPSIPLKICFPHIEMTIADSLKKRITFLQEVAGVLGLNDISFVHERAEQLARKPEHRESYDIVVARAVARMPVLSELCLPFAKIGGTFIAMKGSTGLEEKEEAEKACSLLGGVWKEEYSFTLPVEKSQRCILQVIKEKKTPKTYPRKAGTPSKEPIM